MKKIALVLSLVVYSVFGYGQTLTQQIQANVPQKPLQSTLINVVDSIHGYAPQFILTTTGTSGAATYTGNVLNIPIYAGTVTNVTGSGNIASSGGATPNITFTGILPIANGGTNSSSLTSGAFDFFNGTSVISSTRLLQSSTAGYVEAVNFVKFDSALGIPVFNGVYTAKHIGETILYENAGGDTTICVWNGKRWDSISLAPVTFNASQTGATGISTTTSVYMLNGRKCTITYLSDGTGSATTSTITLPFPSKYTWNDGRGFGGTQSGNYYILGLQFTASSSTLAIKLCETTGYNPFTASGDRLLSFSETYITP